MSEKIDIEALKEYLPFYVNGSIEPDDKAAIDEALAVSPDLRSALEQERELQARFNAALHSELEHGAANAPAASLRNVEPAEDVQPIQPLVGGAQGDATDGAPSSLGAALSFLNPRNWAPAVTFAIAAAAAGQTAVVLAQSGTISDQQAQIANLEAENFALASGQKDCDENASIIVELRETTRWSDAVGLFAAQNLSVVSGTGQGVLMLGFEGEDAELDAIIETLNASELVLDASKAA